MVVVIACDSLVSNARLTGNLAWDFIWAKFWSRDILGFLFLLPFDHSCHLKSGVPSPPRDNCMGNFTEVRLTVDTRGKSPLS